MASKQSFSDLMRQQSDHDFIMSIIEKEGYVSPSVDTKEVYKIDLHGLSAQQAITDLNACYNQALSQGIRRINVVTGQGSGRLIEAVSSLLVQWKQENKIEAWSQTPNKGEFNFRF